MVWEDTGRELRLMPELLCPRDFGKRPGGKEHVLPVVSRLRPLPCVLVITYCLSVSSPPSLPCFVLLEWESADIFLSQLAQCEALLVRWVLSQ